MNKLRKLLKGVLSQSLSDFEIIPIKSMILQQVSGSGNLECMNTSCDNSTNSVCHNDSCVGAVNKGCSVETIAL